MEIGNAAAMFVYGTLRPGQPLFPMIASTVMGGTVEGVVRGYGLWSNWTETYPYMVKTVERDIETVGTLMVCRNNDALARVCRMEVNAGYVVREVEVHFTQRGESKRVSAVAFVLPPESLNMCGEYIESGDWIEFSESVSRYGKMSLDEIDEELIAEEIVEEIPAISTRTIDSGT